MTSALLRLPLARLTRTPRALIPLAGWTLLVLVSAAFARSRAGHHAVDNVLLGIYADVALPLLAFGVVGAVLGGKGLSSASAALTTFGASPARAALAHIAVAGAASAIAGALLAALVVLVGRAGGGGLAYDLAASSYAGLLGGAAYGALFAFGSAFGRNGGGPAGRSVVLVVDWMLGSGPGTGALFVPRGHVHSLLGDPSRLEISPRASGVALVLLTLVFAALATARAARAAR